MENLNDVEINATMENVNAMNMRAAMGNANAPMTKCNKSLFFILIVPIFLHLAKSLGMA